MPSLNALTVGAVLFTVCVWYYTVSEYTISTQKDKISSLEAKNILLLENSKVTQLQHSLDLIKGVYDANSSKKDINITSGSHIISF